MTDIFSALRKSAPAIVMVAGTVPMVAPDAPEHVRYGGACLMAIAMILADLQSGKKLGYTDKIVKAMRKVPGLENADEGVVIGTLTIAVSTFLGGGETINMVENGSTWAGALKVGYNVTSYPLSSVFDFQSSRLLAERYLGKEMTFKYQDAEGKAQTTAPIQTSRLLQQLALISGAVGISAYGTMIDVPSVQFTGVMFAISNGLNIADLIKKPVGELTRSKIESLKKKLNGVKMNDVDELGKAQISQEWKNAKNAFTADSPVASTDRPPPVEAGNLARNTEQAIAPIIDNVQTSADRQPRK